MAYSLGERRCVSVSADSLLAVVAIDLEVKQSSVKARLGGPGNRYSFGTTDDIERLWSGVLSVIA